MPNSESNWTMHIFIPCKKELKLLYKQIENGEDITDYPSEYSINYHRSIITRIMKWKLQKN